MVYKKAPYSKDNYDPWLKELIETVRTKIKDDNDDRLFIVVGETGSGKSTLILHMFQQYLGDKASVEYIGLDKISIARSLKAVTDTPLPRCLMVDEANVNKRSALSRFNKELIDIYLAVRGLNILHFWANPSLDMIDRPFIEERLSGVFYCCTKTPTARVYYYFTQKNILTILNKYGNLKLPLLYKVRKKYGTYMGWYKMYDGPLLSDYLKLKDTRMVEKVEEFFANWGQEKAKDLMRNKQIADYLGVRTDTVNNYVKILLERNVIVEGVNYFKYPNGTVKYKTTLLDDFGKLSKERIDRSKAKARENRYKMIGKKR